jgi:hypothetical protein
VTTRRPWDNASDAEAATGPVIRSPRMAPHPTAAHYVASHAPQANLCLVVLPVVVLHDLPLLSSALHPRTQHHQHASRQEEQDRKGIRWQGKGWQTTQWVQGGKMEAQRPP